MRERKNKRISIDSIETVHSAHIHYIEFGSRANSNQNIQIGFTLFV